MTPRIEQCVYTACDLTLEGTRGYGFGAASAGLLGNNRLKSLEGLVGSALPANTKYSAVTPDSAPVNLALSELGPERVLMHKVFVEHSRAGVFLTHSLVGLPETLRADDAIRLWGSPLWIRRASELGSARQTLHALTAEDLHNEGSLTDAALRERLGNNSFADHLSYLLKAWLGGGAHVRIFVGARPDYVAQLIDGMVRAVPRSMRDGVTFSTYEADVLQAAKTQQIVGTCGPEAREALNPGEEFDLPPVCYATTGWYALNAATDRRTPLTSGDESYAIYVDFVLAQLASKGRDLTELFQMADEADVKEGQSLLTLYLAMQRGSLEDLLPFVRAPSVARKVLGDPRGADVLVAAAERNPDSWKRHIWPDLVSALNATLSDFTLELLVKRIVDNAAAGAENGHADISAQQLRSVGYADSQLASKLWLSLLATLTEERPALRPPCVWDIRRNLLPHWVELVIDENMHLGEVERQAHARRAERWLEVGWDDLAALLQIGLPYQAKQVATAWALRNDARIPRNVGHLVIQNRQLFLDALRELRANGYAGAQAADRLGRALEEHHPEALNMLREVFPSHVAAMESRQRVSQSVLQALATKREDDDVSITLERIQTGRMLDTDDLTRLRRGLEGSSSRRGDILEAFRQRTSDAKQLTVILSRYGDLSGSHEALFASLTDLPAPSESFAVAAITVACDDGLRFWSDGADVSSVERRLASVRRLLSPDIVLHVDDLALSWSRPARLRWHQFREEAGYGRLAGRPRLGKVKTLARFARESVTTSFARLAAFITMGDQDGEIDLELPDDLPELPLQVGDVPILPFLISPRDIRDSTGALTWMAQGIVLNLAETYIKALPKGCCYELEVLVQAPGADNRWGQVAAQVQRLLSATFPNVFVVPGHTGNDRGGPSRVRVWLLLIQVEEEQEADFDWG